MLLSPLLARLFVLHEHGPDRAAQLHVLTVLILCFVPQMIFYGFTTLASALLNARRPLRRRGVRAGAEQRRRDRRAARLRRPHLGPPRLRSPTSPACATTSVSCCCSASARPRASSRWRSCSSPRSRAPACACGSCSRGATPRSARSCASRAGPPATSSRTSSRSCSCSILANDSSGNVSAYVYAFTFYVVPHGLLAVSIMTTMTPNLARRAAAGDHDGLRREFGLGLRYIVVLVLPASVLFAVLAQPMLAVIVRHQFTAHDAVVTADTLQAFAISLVPFSVYLYVMRAFYALQDTRTPFSLNAFENGLNVVLALALFPHFGVQGLALAWSGAYVVAAVVALAGPAPPDRRRPRRRRRSARRSRAGSPRWRWASSRRRSRARSAGRRPARPCSRPPSRARRGCSSTSAASCSCAPTS